MKRDLIPDMYFVYTLCYNGSIFYVGKTKDVHKRYLQHLNKRNKQKTSVFIQAIINAGMLPELNIITYVSDVIACSLESTLIKCISKGGQKLANVTNLFTTEQGCKQMIGLTKKKELCNIIIENQNKFIFKKSIGGAFYTPSLRR